MDIFITLDYELFLGRKTGTPENCLIRPMIELCKVADEFGFKYIIFVDAAYLLRMFQLKGSCPQLSKDYELVSGHVKLLHDQGHDIQLHFHPQWLYSDYDNESNKWILDMDHYKLSDMNKDFAFKMFTQAKILLDELIGKKTYAFRAGGYCLDSFEDYPTLFKENGIRIDSSVARGLNTATPSHKYDYRDVPNDTIYKFQSSIHDLTPDGDFIELSISDCKWSSLEYFTAIRKKMAEHKPTIVYGDGQSIDGQRQPAVKRLKKLFVPYHNLVSIDGKRVCQLADACGQYMRKKQDALVIIGHPKAATDSSILTFRHFMSMIVRCHSIKTTTSL